MSSSSSASSASQTLSSISSSIASAHSTSASSISSTPAPAASYTPTREQEIRDKAQKIVANDLKTWQEKFANAADEGSDELEERMTEITDRLIQSQAQGVGKALIIQLEETVKSSLKSLKSSIISIVEGSKDTEESEEAIGNAVRKAGVAIKEKAQAVRTWRQSFDRETNSLVSKAASNTFEILDHIQDLGLQEIGMRWAWTDGITHKDWTKYHQLKGKFNEWREDVENVIVEHPGIGKARAASEEVENKAMEIAEDAAKELARLKETGRWKLSTGDTSDDWSTKILPAAAVVAGQKVMEKVKEASEAVAPSSQGTIESVASVASSSVAEAVSSASSIAASQAGNAQSAASSISSSVIGAPQGSVESVISVGSSSASSIADQASSSIIGTSEGSVESVASVAKDSASSIADQASSSILGTSQGTIESIISVATDSASSLSSVASASVVGEEPGIVEKASNSVKSAASKASSSLSSATSSIGSSLSKSVTEGSSAASSAASSASSTASKKVWGGAMAQFVEAKQIVYDDIVENSDDDTFSEKVQSLASEAGDKYAELTKVVSEALLKPSSTQGYQVTSLAAQQYSSALAAASSVLYGTEQGTGESIASVASSRYGDAVSA